MWIVCDFKLLIPVKRWVAKLNKSLLSVKYAERRHPDTGGSILLEKRGSIVLSGCQ